MVLQDVQKGKSYLVERLDLPVETLRRLEALGMIPGTKIDVLNTKSHGTIIIKMRQTRFALGKGITTNIQVKEYQNHE